MYFAVEQAYFIPRTDPARPTQGAHCMGLEGSDASKLIFRYVGESGFHYPDLAIQFIYIYY